MSTMRALVLLMIALLLIAANGKAEVYRNEEFGIEVPIPEGVILCPQPVDEHNHGPLFLLGISAPELCDIDHEQTRYIVIFGSYNVAEVTKNPHESLKWECANWVKGPCGPAPNNLEIAGLSSAAARVDCPGGWTDILFATQAGRPDPNFDPPVPSFNYDLRLHTKVEYLEEDLRVFRIILKTIRLSPNGHSKGP